MKCEECGSDVCDKCGKGGELVYNSLVGAYKCQQCGEWQGEN